MTPEIITVLAESAAKIVGLIMCLNAILKIVVWHFTEGTKA